MTEEKKQEQEVSQPFGKAKRRLRNFLLQPLLQIKLGLYTIILAILFSASVAGILYVQLGKVFEIVIQLTDVEEEVKDLLMTYINGTTWWFLLAIGIFIAANILVSVTYTHKLVGPTYAFRRHILQLVDGKAGARTFLRKGDAFSEVADALNLLSEKMEADKTAK